METPKVTIHSDTARAEHDTARGDTAPKDRALPPGTVIDAKGRKIVARPLDALEEFRLAKIMGTNGDSAWARSIALQACSVREFDGDPEAFLDSDREIEAMVGRLGSEGFEAVSRALAELSQAKPKSSKEAVKN
jgi:hypothetical protein